MATDLRTLGDALPCFECTRITDTDCGPGCEDCDGTGMQVGVEVSCLCCGDGATVYPNQADEYQFCDHCDKEWERERDAREEGINTGRRHRCTKHNANTKKGAA